MLGFAQIFFIAVSSIFLILSLVTPYILPIESRVCLGAYIPFLSINTIISLFFKLLVKSRLNIEVKKVFFSISSIGFSDWISSCKSPNSVSSPLIKELRLIGSVAIRLYNSYVFSILNS